MGHFLGCDIVSLGRTILIPEQTNPIPYKSSIDPETGEIIGIGRQNGKGEKVGQWYYLFTFSKRKSLSFFDSKDDNEENLYPIDVYTYSTMINNEPWIFFVNEHGHEEHFTINEILEKSWGANPNSHMFRAVLRVIMSVNGLRIDPSGHRNQKPS